MEDSNEKVNVTLSISRKLHTAFKIEAIRNGLKMSEATEGFMENFVKMSKKLREERIVDSKKELELKTYIDEEE